MTPLFYRFVLCQKTGFFDCGKTGCFVCHSDNRATTKNFVRYKSSGSKNKALIEASEKLLGKVLAEETVKIGKHFNNKSKSENNFPLMFSY